MTNSFFVSFYMSWPHRHACIPATQGSVDAWKQPSSLNGLCNWATAGNPVILINGVSETKSAWSPCFLRPLAAGEVDPLRLLTLHLELIMQALQSWQVSMYMCALQAAR